MTESTQDNTSEQMQLSNRESFDKWNIDPFVDPMSLELETLDCSPRALRSQHVLALFRAAASGVTRALHAREYGGALLVGYEVHRHHARRHASRGVFLRH